MGESIPFLGRHTTLSSLQIKNTLTNIQSSAFKTLEGKELSRIYSVDEISSPLSPVFSLKANKWEDYLGK